MDALLYITVWISLSLFVLAEIARDRTTRVWPRAVSTAGLALLVVHILIAMGFRHEWSHASALAATAAQTDEVYGLGWGGGVYVNYAFVVLWGLGVLGCWGAAGAGGGRNAAEWALRWAFLIVIANAAVVFAGGWRRLLGVAIVAALVAAWFGPRRAA